jgi:hypothetical protein
MSYDVCSAGLRENPRFAILATFKASKSWTVQAVPELLALQ